MTTSIEGFISFVRNNMGIGAQYISNDSEYIALAYNLSIEQVNLYFTQISPLIYEQMVYNLAADILINTAQDYFVAIQSASWLSNTTTITTAIANNFFTGNVVTISGCVPTTYNTSQIITVIDSTHFSYTSANQGTLTVPGFVGFTLFSDLRTKWHINSFTGGVIESSHDESTGQSLAIPDAIRQASLNDLQLFKTPYGRFYLSYAQKFGTNWGLS